MVAIQLSRGNNRPWEGQEHPLFPAYLPIPLGSRASHPGVYGLGWETRDVFFLYSCLTDL